MNRSSIPVKNSLLAIVWVFLFQFSTPLPAQVPSIARWLENATEIKPGLWIGNFEVAIRDYAIFEHYILADSGEVMFRRFAPESRFQNLGYAPGSNRDRDYSNEKGFSVFPVEVDHPIIGIDQRRANGYCLWLTQFCNGLELQYWYEKDSSRVKDMTLVRFRLPSPEEWQLAADQATPPKPHAEFQERPSRYLRTRTVSSTRKGEKGLLHFQDNVSEMTSDPQVVLGGNFEGEGVEKARFSAQTPDLRLGFRIVMEMVEDEADAYKFNPVAYAKQFDRYLMPKPKTPKKHPQGLKDEYYPFDLKKRCFEIEPDIWISNHPVSMGEYAYHLHYCTLDSGGVYTQMQFPVAYLPASPQKARFDYRNNYVSFLPQDKNQPVLSLTEPQIDRFCKWMTFFNEFQVSYPGSTIRYWFRPPTPEEWEKARSHARHGSKLQEGKGFHYVVEVMPIHPDARRFKALPMWQVHLLKRYQDRPWPGFP